jgi:hypothetical protein
MALATLQARCRFSPALRRFAVRTGENFEQFGIDRHDPSGVVPNYNILR